MNKRTTIFIVQLGWPLQDCLLSLINPLADCGLDIHVFYDTRGKFASQEQLSTLKAVFHYLGTCTTSKLALSILSRVRELLDKLPKEIFYRVLSDDSRLTILRRQCTIMSLARTLNLSPALVIGVEKLGLICANRVAISHQKPLVYYCIELFYGLSSSAYSAQIIRLEQQALYNISHLIIQDKDRFRSLCASTGISPRAVTYTPVSREPYTRIDEPTNSTPTKPLSLNDSSRFTVLYAGQVGHYKDFLYFVRSWRLLPRKYHLLLQLHGNHDYIDKLARETANVDNIAIYTAFLDSRQLDILTDECDAGLALYHEEDDNQRLIAKSSQKVASYFRSKKPIITLRNKSFEVLFNEICCGIMINHDLRDLRHALDRLANSYSFYSDNAAKAFNLYYNSRLNAKALSRDLIRTANV